MATGLRQPLARSTGRVQTGGVDASRQVKPGLAAPAAGMQEDGTEAPAGGPAEHSETLQMYLRAVLELHDAGVPPRRARLVERLKVSAPAVSGTVARLAAQDYLVLDEDKVLHLTRRGQLVASDVVRRHELAYRFLHDVLHLDPTSAETEACAWEHVLTSQVEQALHAWLAEQQPRSPAPVVSPAGACGS